MVGGFSIKRLSDSLWYATLMLPHRSGVDGLRRSRMAEEAAAGGDYAVEMLIGEPAETRTQGPRLKSSKERFLIGARYDNGFPTIPCNIEMLGNSISSMRSRLFHSIPAGF